MVRSLWSAASGMKAQQVNVDTISNNLANVNTVGYKKETNEFKALLYQTIQAKTTSANGDTKPVGAQIGLGVKTAAITSIFKQGNITTTDVDTDCAIEGKGFFSVQDVDGEIYYTRNGSFKWAVASENPEDKLVILANSEGLPILDDLGMPIEVDTSVYDVSEAVIDPDGKVSIPEFATVDETGQVVESEAEPLEYQLGIVQFANPSGLQKEGGTLYAVTAASGEPVYESEGVLERSVVRQKCLEASNVSVVDEMVNLIVAQRAYELNSRAITTSDTMMEQANNLKR